MSLPFFDLKDNFDISNFLVLEVSFPSKVSDQQVNSFAAFSSTGIESEQTEKQKAVNDIYSAKVYAKRSLGKRTFYKIAYPVKLLENDNIPQLISHIQDGVSVLENPDVIVENITFPQVYVKNYIGPAYGKEGIQDFLDSYTKNPAVCFVKEGIGQSVSEYCQKVKELWLDGNDIVYDKTSMTDQDFCPFYERVNSIISQRREVENKLKKKKIYCPNISARMSEMYSRGKYVRQIGGRGITIDISAVGFSGLQFIREQNLELLINAPVSREDISAFNFSIKVFSKIARLSGIDNLVFDKNLKGKFDALSLQKEDNDLGSLKKMNIVEES